MFTAMIDPLALKLSRPSLIERCRAWKHRPSPVTVQSILAAAEAEQLQALLNQHYTIYYHPHWQAKLKLCRDLVDAGYLSAEFEEHYDGSPIFISDDARITIVGRDHLATLRKNNPKRRLLAGIAIFLSGVLSKSIVTYLSTLFS